MRAEHVARELERCGTPASLSSAVRMRKPCLKRRARAQTVNMERSFRLGSIAMLPAGLILLVSSIAQLSSGDYTIRQNFYAAPVGPAPRAIMGFVLMCLGAIFLWLLSEAQRSADDPTMKSHYRRARAPQWRTGECEGCELSVPEPGLRKASWPRLQGRRLWSYRRP